MKGKVLVILSVVAGLHLIIIGGVFMSGGCKHPEVLQDRINVPAPVSKPGEAPVEAPVPKLLEPVKPDTSLAPLPDFDAAQLKYTVEKGDSLWKIAKKYGVSTDELAAHNNIAPSKPLKVGTVLTIPPGGALVPEVKKTHVEAGKADKKTVERKHEGADSVKGITAAKEKAPADGYVVKSNDSIWKIAAKFGVPSQKIIDANKLDPKKPLQVGQKLAIPSGAEAAKPSATAAAAKPAPVAATPAATVKSPAAATTPATAAPSELDKILDEGTAPAPVTTGAAAPAAAAAATPVTPVAIDFIDHEVVDGETVADVAGMYGVKPEDVRKLNPEIPADGKLKAGSTLKIPQQ